LISKIQQLQVEWRRDRVSELSSQGYSQSDIATVLHVDKSIISRDMAHLRHRAQEKLKRHIDQTIPEEYSKACNTVNMLLKMTWSIAVKTEDEKTRLQALALINDVNKYRTDLVTNGVIVNNALQIVQSKLEHLNGNGKGKEKEKLLYDIKEDAEADDAEAAEACDNGLSNNSEGEGEQPTHNGIF
jgi:predicted transcriptional regulator